MKRVDTARRLSAKITRAVAIAVLVLLMAVTPLSAFLSGGNFETWVGGSYGRPIVRIGLTDHTGLVRQVSRAEIEGGGPVQNPGGNQRVLVVDVWGGCGDYAVHLQFRRVEQGYLIRQRNSDLGCPFLDLLGHGAVALALWSPVDAATVRLESPYVSAEE